MKKKDWILIAGILLVALAVWAGMRLSAKRQLSNLPARPETSVTTAPENPAGASTQLPGTDSGGMIVISAGGKLYGKYSLSEDQEISINDTNVCRIEDGQAVMVQANCPDQLCTFMGPVSGPNDLIVCLPNMVIIEWEAGEEAADEPVIDGVS